MQVLAKPTRFLLFLFLLFGGLYIARTVLIPLAIGGLLAALFSSVCDCLEKRGVNRGMATLLCIVCFVLVVSGIVLLLALQSSDLVKNMDDIKQRLTAFMEPIRQFVSTTLGIEPQEQKAIVAKQTSDGGSLSSIIKTVIESVMGVLVDLVLILVYTYLLLYFRGHLKGFILRLVAKNRQTEAREVIDQSSEVAQRYLIGLFTIIAMLWVLYGVGFTIVGVKQAVFLAILCGLLEMIPFIGNLTGSLLAVLVSLAQGGDSRVVLGILVVYGIVQFTQTYLIEPLVVGNEVSINPLFTILVIVVGEAVWGVSGMILALPALGVVKVICDHVEPLKPYGFLIGQEKPEKESSGMVDKLKHLLRKA
jgi:predicted PurR-regulated permease PerM